MGDVVRLRKAHPCGGLDWQIVRLGAETGAALVGAGILSVLVFPLGALTLLRRDSAGPVEP